MDYSLKAIFGMDGTGFRADLKQTMAEARTAVNQWANLVAGGAVAAVAALSKGAIDLASHLSDTAQNLGINVESLQALEAQHKRNGVSEEQMVKVMEKTRAFSIDAINGDEKALATLKALNIERVRFIGLPLDKQYAAIANATDKALDRSKAYNAVGQIFGEKIGPKLQASLLELGQIGLPKVTEEARKAGQVMSAETIVALDRAGDAIDDFKRKITVAIGNIIVNFRTKEGMELLLFEFLEVVGVFGAKIIDALVEAAGMIKAVFWGELSWVVNKFRDGFLDAVMLAAQGLNKILPQKFQINIAGIEQLKSAGKDLGDSIIDAIANTKPSTFAKDVTDYWDKAISDQQGVVTDLNKVDLGKEAKKLTDGGKDFEKSGKVAAAAIVDAGQTAASTLVQAANVIGGAIGRTGKDSTDLDNGQLNALVQNLKQNLFTQKMEDSHVMSTFLGPEGYKSPQQYVYEQELAKAQAEQQLRENYTRDLARFGQGYIDRYYAPSDVDRLKNAAGMTSQQEQTNQKLDTLTDTIQDRLPVGGISDLTDQIKKGMNVFVQGPTGG